VVHYTFGVLVATLQYSQLPRLVTFSDLNLWSNFLREIVISFSWKIVLY